MSKGLLMVTIMDILGERNEWTRNEFALGKMDLSICFHRDDRWNLFCFCFSIYASKRDGVFFHRDHWDKTERAYTCRDAVSESFIRRDWSHNVRLGIDTRISGIPASTKTSSLDMDCFCS